MRDIATKSIGAKFYYQDCNSIAKELINLVETSGQTLDEADNFQEGKAVAIYVAVGNFYTDTGTADHYILSPIGIMQIPVAYQEGMSVRFRATHENTGVSDIAVAGLGTVSIKKEDGTALGAGDIVAGQINELIYNGFTNCFELYSHKFQDQVFNTGDNILTDATGNRAGWIWINDNTKTTIGDAASNATIRNNADCEALFTLYWAFNATDCPIYTSLGAPSTRGANAAADWAADKRLAIPTKFRRVLAAHDINDTLRVGQAEGDKLAYLTDASMNASHGHGVSDPTHGHGPSTIVVDFTAGNIRLDTNGNGTGRRGTDGSGTGIGIQGSGTGAGHLNMQPTTYVNLYIKL